VVDRIINQKICITGGGGALGRSLVTKLIEYGASDIAVLDKQPCSSVCEKASVSFVEGSILDKAHLRKALKGCDVIFHLAALTNAGQSSVEPERYIQTNCIGTMTVLEVCKELKVSKMIYPSTSHVYGHPETIPVNEKHPTKPLSVYAASKLAGESVTHACSSSSGISSVIARLSNLYSTSSGPDTVIGLALDQVMSGTPIHLQNLSAARDFLYIDDASEALIRLSQSHVNKSGSVVVNVSTSQAISIEEICKILANTAHEHGLKKPEIIRNSPNIQEKIPILCLDNALLQEITNWTPQITMKQGLSLILKHRLQ
jgi:nucleoside-diphosphate-sugar epimerase